MMALRQFMRAGVQMEKMLGRCQPMPTAARTLSTTSTLKQNVSVEMQENGVAIMKLVRKPVNSMNLELLTEMCIELDKIDADKSCKGLILTSGVPGIFSGGLDIMEMYQPKEERLQAFWRQLQETWMRLYGMRVPTIAAINGHAPAGGCLMSMASDYRIMAEGKYTIGLNEVKLGIVAPYWFIDLMVATVGEREAEKGLQLGMLYSAPDALRIGMVDETMPESEVLTRAQTVINEWTAVPAAARHISKLSIRQPAIDKLRSKQQEDINNFVSFVTKSSVQKTLAMYLEMLKKKASKSKM